MASSSTCRRLTSTLTVHLAAALGLSQLTPNVVRLNALPFFVTRPRVGGDPEIRAKIESVGKAFGFTVMNQETNLGLGKALGASTLLL